MTASTDGMGQNSQMGALKEEDKTHSRPPNPSRQIGYRNRSLRQSVALLQHSSPAQRTPPLAMDALVPPDVTAELTQILSNLVLGDNEIRSKYATSSSPTPYLTTHFFQRRGCRRRAFGSQTRCLSSRSDSICHKSRHCRSGRSTKPHFFYRYPNNPRVLYI